MRLPLLRACQAISAPATPPNWWWARHVWAARLGSCRARARLLLRALGQSLSRRHGLRLGYAPGGNSLIEAAGEAGTDPEALVTAGLATLITAGLRAQLYRRQRR